MDEQKNDIKTKSAGKTSNSNDRRTKIPKCLARSVVFVVTAFANIIVIYDDFRIQTEMERRRHLLRMYGEKK